MMSNTMSSIPAVIGTAFLSTLGRFVAWSIKKYAAAPLTSTVTIALALGLSMAANNALFGQVDHHPAPLFFGSETTTQAPAVEPIPPIAIAPPPTRSLPLASIEPSSTEASQPPVQNIVMPAVPDTGDVSNAELADAQRKLQSLGLFDGDVDGFYGPKTAEAIRAFELRNGLTPKGDMSRVVIDAILRTNAADGVSINAARTVARSAETTTGVSQVPEVDRPETANLSGGQVALQALISPQTEVDATPTQPAETFVATPVAIDQETSVAAVSETASEVGSNPLTNTALIERIQSGLASLGFLHSRIDGVAGEGTARAIRNFEVFNNYEVTGSVTPELVDLLIAAGADI